jgi:hypothetical protein
MKRKLLLSCILIFLLLAAVGLAYASTADYTLPWWTVDNGGGASSGGNYSLSGTIGQPDAGALSGGNYQLEGGFWGRALSGGTSYQPVYLPIVRK